MTALEMLDAHFLAMPPVAAMRIQIAAYDGTALSLRAPLAANVNDKGCAFGGSLASVMTLAGWGLINLKLSEAGLAAEVYVADSHLRYLAPLYDDLLGEARLAEQADWPGFLRRYRERGRARIALTARISTPDGGPVAEMGARFAALRGNG